MKYIITNIQWDTDGISPRKLKLPTKTTVNVPECGNVEDRIADYLSDTYGFCVKGYNYEPDLPREQKILKSQLQEMGYKVHISEEEGVICAELENWTNGGEDMLVWLNPFTLEELKSYAENYDVDDHIELMMQGEDYRKHFTHRQAVEDQEAWLKELKQNIHNLEVLRGIFHEKEPGKKDNAKTTPDIVAVVKALAQYRQLNVNWWKNPEKTAERLQDFIGKEPLEVTPSASAEDTITVTLTATQQRRLLDYVFEDKEGGRRAMAADKHPDPGTKAVMEAYDASLDELIKTLSV